MHQQAQRTLRQRFKEREARGAGAVPRLLTAVNVLQRSRRSDRSNRPSAASC